MKALSQAFTRVRPPRSLSSRPQAFLLPAFTHRVSPPQLLQFQSYLPYQFAANQTASISTSSPGSLANAPDVSTQPSSPLDPDAARILDFWFGDLPADEPTMKWYKKDEDFDDEIRTKFGHLVEKARETEELDSWAETPRGTIALLLLLDQFPRNIYRHSYDPQTSRLSYASDDKAQKIALQALTHKSPSLPSTIPPCAELPVFHQQFLYMPFMHAEDLALQLLGKALLENLSLRAKIPDSNLDFSGHDPKVIKTDILDTSVGFAQKHVDCIKELGRFPKRNEAMKRETTDREWKWLEDYPDGF